MKHYRVAAAVIIHEGKVFACRRGYGEWKGWWEFPGGKIEPGETPGEALIREIREELAADIAVERPIATVEYDYPDFHLTMHCFLARFPRNANPRLLEHEAARWLRKEELRQVEWLPADVEVVNHPDFMALLADEPL